MPAWKLASKVRVSLAIHILFSMWFLHSSFFYAFFFLPKEQKWVTGKVYQEELYVVYKIYKKKLTDCTYCC
jgi:hypothetical protein